MFGRKTPENREDSDTFAQRIRNVIEEHSGRTSGIKVFEHSSEITLDEQERQILERLRIAHEEWQAKNQNSSKNTQDDAYKSVKVRI